MPETVETVGERSEACRRALWLHQMSIDAHAVFVSYAYVHVALFALFYVGALSRGAFVLSDAVLAVAVFLSLVARLVSVAYVEHMLNRWRDDQTRQK
jgi:hypothetical protein